MFKNNIFTKAVSIMVMGSFVFVTTPKKTKAQMLVPVSFSQMYYLAQNGQVEALRASVRRGMNIDVMNRNGDTGLCIAARRRDSYTYNAFRAAGANPRHPCTQTVEGYADFVNSAKTTPINSTSRAAYGMIGKESYKVAPWVWWTGGALLVGGGIALALSGGGGGGGGNDSPAPEPVYNIDSAGRYLAQNGSIKYTAAKGEVKANSSDISMSNENTSISTMKFNENVTQNGKALNVILSAKNGGSYTNNANTDLSAKSGVVAMAAYKSGSVATNNGALNVSGYNAAIGMLAGDNAAAYNNGSENNGIKLSYAGYSNTDTIIGMYADAGSRIVNEGTINGTASLIAEGTTTATKGSMTGMEVMIVNANTDSSSTTSSAINNGVIDLVAGQNATGSDENVEVSIVGMGTYLDYDFLHGGKNIKRGEKALITNNDTINLSYYGIYSSEDNYLRKGTGGIIGMKADANGTAINNKDITIKMSTSDSSPSTYEVAAGMQSIHGGNITNSANGNISLAVSAEDNRIAYGMVAVEGSGSVSGLYDIAPTVTNDGKINLNISNGYGMASYTGGTLANNGEIILGTVEGEYASNNYTGNIGMYGSKLKATKLINSETINIYSKDSVAMKDDFSGKTTITNDGNIIINAGADGSHPFAGIYSNIVNKGEIIYNVSETGGESSDFPDKFVFGLKNAVLNTDGENNMPSTGSSTGSSGYSDVTITNEKKITLNGSSYTAAMLNQGSKAKLINNGTILLKEKEGYNTYQSVGMYASADTGIDSAVVNKGTIWVDTQYSGAIVSDATDEGVIITNDVGGEIVINSDNSVGMYASGSASIYNNGTITVVGNNSFAIIAKGKGTGASQQKIYNNGEIVLSSEGATAFYIADKSTAIVVKEGTIRVEEDDTVGYRIDGDLTIYALPEIKGQTTKGFIYYDVAGKLTVDLASAEVAKSTLARAINGGVVEITSRSTINTSSEGTTLFKGLAGSSITNGGTLNIEHANSYGISTQGSITNNGTISISSANAYGIYTETSSGSANNSGTISAGGENSTGMYAKGSSSATNSKIINVSGKNAKGMYGEGGSSIGNTSSINVNNTSGETAYAMSVNGSGTNASNSGTINATSKNAVGMQAVSGASISNNGSGGSTTTTAGTISASGENSIGMSASGSNSGADNSGTIAVSGLNSVGMQASSGASVINNAPSGSSATGGGIINVSSEKANGMYAQGNGSNGSNGGTISVDGNNSYGMYATDGATTTNVAGAAINVGGEEAYGMYAQGNGSNGSNGGTISVSGNNSFGMHTYNGGTATNSSSIEVSGEKSYGISVNGSGENATAGNNSSTISVTGEDATGMLSYGSKAQATNSGTISQGNIKTAGMYASSGGKITNSNTITLNESATESYGMYASGTGSTATNKKEIYVNSDNSSGMYATSSATATNEEGATIDVKGGNSYAMYAKGSSATSNSGTLDVEGEGSYGVYITGSGSTGSNSGTIEASGESSFGLFANDGGTATNSSAIIASGKDSSGISIHGEGENNTTGNNSSTISVTGEDATGMLSYGSKAQATNSGTISQGNIKTAGMYASSGGKITNSNTITLNESATESYGMYASGTGSTATNEKEIYVNTNNSSGMYATSSATATNEEGATISVKGNNSYGMFATNKGNITNNNIITIESGSTESYGMYVSGTDSIATNNKYIYVNADNSGGMYATDGATATNDEGATIDVNGNNSYGMVAKNGGKVINNGVINVNNTTSFGMMADGSGSEAQNKDKVYVLNEDLIATNGVIAQNEGTTSGDPAEKKPSLSASPLMMSATKAGKIINNGVINANSAIDFNSDDTSSISVGNGGSYVAPSFSGDVLADSNITTNGFENVYVNENSFVGEDKGLKISSGSYMFDAQKAVNDNGNIDVVMTKKDFADVVENSSLAEFLEDNYAEKNNESLYNDLKASGNSAEFSQNVDDLFGNDLISELTFEDLNLLRELNFNMNNNMFAQEKGSFALSDGIEVVKKEKFGSTGQYALAGYNDGKTAIGVGLSVSEANVAKNKQGQKAKHGKNIMLSMPISHKSKGFEFITSPKAGYASGTYEREGINGMSYDGNVERKTLALMNEARYPFSLNGVKIIPNAEFNMIGYNMKAKEDTKQYSLNIKSQNHYSVESGLGLNIEKEFAASKDSKLKLNGGVSFYKEFADPYNLKVSMNEMNGAYKIKDEKHGDKRTVLRFGAGYNVKENLDISAMIRTNIDREYRTDTGVSLNYHF